MYNKSMIFLTDKEILEKIVDKLILKRKSLGLSQKDLAEKAGLSYRTIQTMESGTSPNLTSFIAILRALGELNQLDSFLNKEIISPKLIHQKKNK